MKAANPTMKLSVVYLLGHRVNVIKAVLERAHIHTHTHTRTHAHKMFSGVCLCVFDIYIPGGVICMF